MIIQFFGIAASTLLLLATSKYLVNQSETMRYLNLIYVPLITNLIFTILIPDDVGMDQKILNIVQDLTLKEQVQLQFLLMKKQIFYIFLILVGYYLFELLEKYQYRFSSSMIEVIHSNKKPSIFQARTRTITVFPDDPQPQSQYPSAFNQPIIKKQTSHMIYESKQLPPDQQFIKRTSKNYMDQQSIQQSIEIYDQLSQLKGANHKFTPFTSDHPLGMDDQQQEMMEKVDPQAKEILYQVVVIYMISILTQLSLHDTNFLLVILIQTMAVQLLIEEIRFLFDQSIVRNLMIIYFFVNIIPFVVTNFVAIDFQIILASRYLNIGVILQFIGAQTNQNFKFYCTTTETVIKILSSLLITYKFYWIQIIIQIINQLYQIKSFQFHIIIILSYYILLKQFYELIKINILHKLYLMKQYTCTFNSKSNDYYKLFDDLFGENYTYTKQYGIERIYERENSVQSQNSIYVHNDTCVFIQKVIKEEIHPVTKAIEKFEHVIVQKIYEPYFIFERLGFKQVGEIKEYENEEIFEIKFMKLVIIVRQSLQTQRFIQIFI
ncbi:hypothetical protein pb186bvf_014771 [Paramecium bursaria]